MKHPFFWEPSKKLLFIKDASDRVESEKITAPIVEALEAKALLIVGADWSVRVSNLLIDNIGKYRKYNYGSVRDLLRVIRNKSHHYRDLPIEVQNLLGSLPEGFLNYWLTRFPNLLLQVYLLIEVFSKGQPAEDWANVYF